MPAPGLRKLLLQALPPSPPPAPPALLPCVPRAVTAASRISTAPRRSPSRTTKRAFSCCPAAMSKHAPFKEVEASRPDWDRGAGFAYTKTADPSWTYGQGANSLPSSSSDSSSDGTVPKHVAIDPYEDGRPAGFNYKLLISGVVPRPIGFVSTVSADGARNLAPFSYFNVVHHDPPMFVLGLASPLAAPKDTLRNLVETKSCVVSVISEHFLEAANATSVDAPPGRSEWAVSGLTPVADCRDTPAPRVREAVFSVECRLDDVREFDSRARPGSKTGCLVVLEGTRFWVREDALDADRSQVDAEVLRPVSRLGGITYGRVTGAVELPRPSFERDVGGDEGYARLEAELGEKEKEKESQGETGKGSAL
ncbi:hypothetical protein GGR56DRAFT_258406 [Xylariaceae sp. FL0804]|nr:hypothetical protein GGR56DRAFT_258406 [Xylariaceae sp. FL0804]